ncbi:DUF4251 domain-containing protein [uncultured Winogradskyella sp.]|uniref:DUF4251 domain-containing protein n=1 Tax=uncultured Winogradskyella sp. TaxID=395353 RepID=UPI00260710B4|nr:DUF4251 domain-containing protein [uncultured Winogradskyella sp.]
MKTSGNIKHFMYGLALATMALVMACKSSQPSVEQTLAFNNLETKLKSKSFKIDVHTALPFTTKATTQVLNQLMQNTGNTANHITISGYNITFKNDSISGQLPFYGERQLGSGAYNGNLGIAFSDIPNNYSITKHKKKEAYIIKFNINDKDDQSEIHRVTITLFANNSADINIIPSHRNNISYRGQLIDTE